MHPRAGTEADPAVSLVVAAVLKLTLRHWAQPAWHWLLPRAMPAHTAADPSGLPTEPTEACL